jgi:7,8-dihydroneopterin aldolase/epimerase/oxygenase
MPQNAQPFRIANAANSVRHVFVHDLLLSTNIGIYQHEKDGTQPVRFNIDLTVRESNTDIDDSIENVVCYEEVVKKVEKIINYGHLNLVETLAEEIAASCLEDPMVLVARVRVEKLEAIPNAASVGVEIERTRSD